MKALVGRFLVILLSMLILTESRAHAYIDPGTGSMVWQLLLAAGVGTLFYVWKAMGWMGRLRRRKKAGGAHRSPGTPSLKSGREAGESPPLNPENS